MRTGTCCFQRSGAPEYGGPVQGPRELVDVEALGVRFQEQAACSQKSLHVGSQKKDIRQPAQQSERGFVEKDIGHLRFACSCDTEKMIVIEALEWTTYLRIAKAEGPLKGGNTAGQPLPDEKVSRFPSHLLAGLN